MPVTCQSWQNKKITQMQRRLTCNLSDEVYDMTKR